MAATTSEPRLRLMAFGPAWGMPSMDAASTKAAAWMKFCGLREGADFEIDPCSKVHVGLTGELPMLQSIDAEGNPLLAEPHEVCSALAALGHDADAKLSAAQRAESLAFSALIEERLHVALLYAWWEDEVNYDAVIRPTLGATLSMPLTIYLPWMLRRRVHSQLARRRCLGTDTAYAMGEAALEALAVRLGSRPFFHGDAPTGVDASAFGYLSAALRCPLPNDRLRVAMRSHPNLVAFCERIAGAHFGGSEPLLPATTPAPPRLRNMNGRQIAEQQTAGSSNAPGVGDAVSTKEVRTPKQERFRRRSRNAVLGALGTAVAYALAVGTFDKEAEESDED